MFFQLCDVEMTRANQAAAQAERFTEFHALAAPWKRHRADGSTEVAWSVRIPCGRRPTAIEKYLKQQHPHVKWRVVEIDDDGFEVNLSTGRLAEK